MTSIPQVAEAIGRILTAEADQLAREVGFIQRERVRSRGRLCANRAAGLAADVDRSWLHPVYSVQRNTFDDITLNVHLVSGDIVYGYAQSGPIF